MVEVSKRLKRLVYLFMSLMLVLGMSFSTAYATTGPANDPGNVSHGNNEGSTVDNDAEPSSNDSDYSFYKVSSAAATYFSDSQSPEGDGVDPKWTNVHSNGDVLGYTDPDLTKGITSWLWSKATNSSGTRSFNSFKTGTVKTDNSGDDKGSGVGLLSYAYYGAALNALGLDHCQTKVGFSMTRVIGGNLMLLMYYLSLSVTKMFHLAIVILQNLNPFRWFNGALRARFGEGIVNDGNDGAFAKIIEFVGDLYNTLYDMGWSVIMPLFLAMLLANLLLFKIGAGSHEKKAMIKRFIIRCFFIVLGIPILGTLYTMSLNQMASQTSDGNLASNQVILSTFLDFESWASKHRLSLPANAVVQWDAANSRPTILSQINGRQNCAKINALTYGNIASGLKSDDLNGQSIGDWNTSVTSTANSGDQKIPAVKSLLERYISGASYQSSDWETAVKAGLTKKGKKDDKDKKKLKETILDATDPKNYTGDHAKVTPENLLFDTKGGRIYYEEGNNGTLHTTDSKNIGTNLNSTAPLSAIGMYNYLNTDFENDSMEVYSTEKSANEHVKPSHKSVNLVGSGVISFLYWINAFVILMVFTILGFVYAIGMIFSSIRRSLLMIAETPFAMLGAYRSITKVIIYTIALIGEVLGTMFIYMFVQQILLALPKVMEDPMAATFKNSHTAGTGILLIVMLLFNAIIYITFLVYCIRVRKMVVKALNEWAKSVVESIMGSGDTGADLEHAKVPGSESAKKAKELGKGLVAGAGIGMMANALANKKDIDGNGTDGFAKKVGTGKEDDEDDESKSVEGEEGEGAEGKGSDGKDGKDSKKVSDDLKNVRRGVGAGGVAGGTLDEGDKEAEAEAHEESLKKAGEGGRDVVEGESLAAINASSDSSASVGSKVKGLKSGEKLRNSKTGEVYDPSTNTITGKNGEKRAVKSDADLEGFDTAISPNGAIRGINGDTKNTPKAGTGASSSSDNSIDKESKTHINSKNSVDERGSTSTSGGSSNKEINPNLDGSDKNLNSEDKTKVVKKKTLNEADGGVSGSKSSNSGISTGDNGNSRSENVEDRLDKNRKASVKENNSGSLGGGASKGVNASGDNGSSRSETVEDKAERNRKQSVKENSIQGGSGGSGGSNSGISASGNRSESTVTDEATIKHDRKAMSKAGALGAVAGGVAGSVAASGSSGESSVTDSETVRRHKKFAAGGGSVSSNFSSGKVSVGKLEGKTSEATATDTVTENRERRHKRGVNRSVGSGSSSSSGGKPVLKTDSVSINIKGDGTTINTNGSKNGNGGSSQPKPKMNAQQKAMYAAGYTMVAASQGLSHASKSSRDLKKGGDGHVDKSNNNSSSNNSGGSNNGGNSKSSRTNTTYVQNREVSDNRSSRGGSKTSTRSSRVNNVDVEDRYNSSATGNGGSRPIKSGSTEPLDMSSNRLFTSYSKPFKFGEKADVSSTGTKSQPAKKKASRPKYEADGQGNGMMKNKNKNKKHLEDGKKMMSKKKLGK